MNSHAAATPHRKRPAARIARHARDFAAFFWTPPFARDGADPMSRAQRLALVAFLRAQIVLDAALVFAVIAVAAWFESSWLAKMGFAALGIALAMLLARMISLGPALRRP